MVSEARYIAESYVHSIGKQLAKSNAVSIVRGMFCFTFPPQQGCVTAGCASRFCAELKETCLVLQHDAKIFALIFPLVWSFSVKLQEQGFEIGSSSKGFDVTKVAPVFFSTQGNPVELWEMI
ncbi:hypothetical protein VNO77_44100 [Canavalia gladiata]|uniref:Uncharacterized protein n=1 Tax=Canavalia gladiata TaxID=3824 RepID=A0AAN9JZ08_CANGL